MRWLILVLCACNDPKPAPDASAHPFDASSAGAEKVIAGVRFAFCPAGTFMMGSPSREPERRPGEDQKEVTLTKGFYMAKLETTQGDWKRDGRAAWTPHQRAPRGRRLPGR